MRRLPLEAVPQLLASLASNARRALLCVPAESSWRMPLGRRLKGGGRRSTPPALRCAPVHLDAAVTFPRPLTLTICLPCSTAEEFGGGHAPGAKNVPVMLKGPAGMSPNPEFVKQVWGAEGAARWHGSLVL